MIDFSRPTALFGGSFDPVHEGHLHIANAVQKLRPEIEQIVFVPAAHSPGKTPTVAAATDRLRWLEMVAKPAGFLVWDEEIRREGESYTVDTLHAAHRAGATKEKLYWIMGGDAYVHFAHWKSPDVIRSLCQLIAVNRPGVCLPAQQPGDIVLEIQSHAASSTEIRAALAAGRDDCPYLPASVNRDLERLALRSLSPYVRKKV
ncbi:MAG: nicotinate (nicotinamide) nucleotide adenylyltransferase [Bdellovibrionota bacterium]